MLSRVMDEGLRTLGVPGPIHSSTYFWVRGVHLATNDLSSCSTAQTVMRTKPPFLTTRTNSSTAFFLLISVLK
uniref:Alkylated DNA repair protein alkB homolog 8 n=1 Tax=Rhizophora mucronata TaxID=61149 RepID=A0A2P2JFU2_RHIMU